MSEVAGFFGGAVFPRTVPFTIPKRKASYDFAFGFPPVKKHRHSVLFPILMRESRMEDLPDECLYEIFRRVSGTRERSACASVSKKWLMMLASIRGCELLGKPEAEDDGSLLSRIVDAGEVTDVSLVAIAVCVGESLGELDVIGGGVTDGGLKAIARCCPKLRSLSIRGGGRVTDESMIEIAVNCPGLKTLKLEECGSVGGGGGIQEVSRRCGGLEVVHLDRCPLVNDRAIATLVTASSYTLRELRLRGLVELTDMTVAVVGHYGRSLTDLVLSDLPGTTERGFWVMGNGQGLQKLRMLDVARCAGATDLGIEAVLKGCPNLRHIVLRHLSSRVLMSLPPSLDLLQMGDNHYTPSLLLHILKSAVSVSNDRVAAIHVR